MNDKYFLRLAIKKSLESFELGAFPAGALVVKDNKIISEAISSAYPGYAHADSKAIAGAFNTTNSRLESATLYCSMESCLMCISTAFWAGIERICFAIKKDQLNPNYFETTESNEGWIKRFSKKIELIHIKELEKEALAVVKAWEKR